MRLLAIFSLLLVALLMAGCPGGPLRPDADFCGINGAKNNRRCYNMLRDYDQEGRRYTDAQPKTYSVPDLKSLNGHICMDPESAKRVELFLKQSRDWVTNHCK